MSWKYISHLWQNEKKTFPLLVEHQFQKINQETATNVKKHFQRSHGIISSLRLPGNVRELNNLLERSVILCQEETLKPEHLGSFVSKVLTAVELLLNEEAPLEQIRMRAEANAIRKALELTGETEVKQQKC